MEELFHLMHCVDVSVLLSGIRRHTELIGWIGLCGTEGVQETRLGDCA